MSLIKHGSHINLMLIVFLVALPDTAASAQWRAYSPLVSEASFESDDPIEACSQVDEYFSIFGGHTNIELAYGSAWNSYAGTLNYYPGRATLHCQFFDEDYITTYACGIGANDFTEAGWIPFRCQDFALLEVIEDEKEAGNPPCRIANGSNPIHTASGNKYQRETDFNGVEYGSLKLVRHYNSLFTFPGSFGSNWRGKYDRALLLTADNNRVILIRDDGKLLALEHNKTSDRYELNKSELNHSVTKTDTGWILKLPKNITETYDGKGRLLSLSNNHITEHVIYKETQPAISIVNGTSHIDRVEDEYGRRLVFTYNSDGMVSEVSEPNGNTIRYEYTNKLISKVIYSPSVGQSTKREYIYDNPDHPKALTGIIDENDVRFATWSYDEQGRAISSEHAEGADRTILTYNDNGTTTVTNPLGKQTTYHFETIHGVRQVVEIEGHPTQSCDGTNRFYRYDDNGFLISKTDWKGTITNYNRDAKGRELVRYEAVGTPEARKVTTEWHMDFDQPVRVIEPRQIINYRYNDQGILLERTITPNNTPASE
ncbi:MAG: DUF6531 domain-containing protein [Candidatus Thiodiazotropha sp.]|jgi:YD repeat-containing protein